MNAAPVPLPPAPSFRKIWLAGTAVLVALAALLAWESPLTSGLRERALDVYQVLSPRRIESAPATIVAIDEKSLAALGQWPWPRTVLARLIGAIARHGPLAIGVDMLMPEPDGLSPERLLAAAREDDPILAGRLALLPSNDAELARAVAAAPVVMALAGTLYPTQPVLRVAPVSVVGPAAGMPKVVRVAGAIRSIDEVDGAAAGHGMISVGRTETVIDRSQPGQPAVLVGHTEEVIRRVPLFFDIAGTLAPAFSIEMLRVATGAPFHRLHASASAVQGFSLGDFAARTEADGAVRVYFSKGSGTRYVSAVDVLDGKVDPLRLERRLVLIGLTGLTLHDYQNTPVGDRMPGSEIHAQLLENLYDGTLLDRPRWAGALELAVFVALGALLIWATPRWAPRNAALLALGCVFVPAAAAFIAFRTHRLLFDAAMPGIGLLVLFAVLLVLTLGEAARHGKALEGTLRAQREQAAYVAGELGAAHRIQTGILPSGDLLRADPRIDLAARMEPAREVGGDLYDFFPLPDDRLFFLIGDVAGKGLSASMFMLVSKALYKSAVLRSGGACVGEQMRAANAEVARDNSELLFVTAFAGVLELETGELSYCNAGHENPWLLGPGRGATARLGQGGGPPLCTVSNYPYREARVRLTPGQTLCLVTDGVFEAQNAAGGFYGIDRLQAVLARVDPGRATAREIVDAVCADLEAFVGGAEFSDDRTLLVLRWNGPRAAAGPGR